MIGLNSKEILKEIVKGNPSIQRAELLEFGRYSLAQERIDNSELDIAFNEAMKLREKYNLPFWDGFNLNLFNRSINDFGFLREILFQNEPCEKVLAEREDILNDNYQVFKGYTALSSKVWQDETKLHLPLLDFHIPIGERNERIAIEVVKLMGLSGFLLDSGKSYHFIGKEIINEAHLNNILFKSLLFAPIIDRAWVAHQLIQGFCCLRISEKYNRLPFVVATV